MPPLIQRVANAVGWRKSTERAYFDADYYRSQYHDIASTRTEPFGHFMAHGWREGRNPSASFSTLFYRDSHLDGAEVNPLTHYIASGGQASGFATVAATEATFLAVQRTVVRDHFDAVFYALQVGAMASDPIEHYLSTGWREGRSPSPSFDASRYCRENSYVAALGVSPLYHFASQKRLTERDAKPLAVSRPQYTTGEVLALVQPEFDAEHYLANNADVRVAKLDPLLHFVEHGWRERRNPNAFFDIGYYLGRNPDVAATGVNPFFHYLKTGRVRGLRANPVGVRAYPPLRAPRPADWAAAVPAADPAAADYVVIMPVYRGHDETLAAIHAVLTARQRVRFVLLVIDDASPDAALAAALAELAGKGLFSLHRNDGNLGFVKSCNLGLRRHAEREAVLLNADAKVSGDWLDRFDAHARRDPTIATITPLSNNATINSYPVINNNNLIETECPPEVLDELAASCNAGRTSEVPTGIGFCFFMSRRSRHAIGLLDEHTFGRGYGEENDFCLRAAKAGFRNVRAEDVFVYHAGQVSFAGLTADDPSPGQKALVGKHPDYPARIAQFMAADPGIAGRMRLDLARLARWAAPEPIMFVSHALAGGIVTHIKDLERRLAADGVKVIHLRVGVADRWSVTVAADADDAPFCPNLLPTSFHQLRPLLNDFLQWLRPRAIHLHSLVGFDWGTTAALMDFVRGSGVPYYFTLHDYSVVCHRNNLVQPSGRYCGLPEVAVCRACVAGDRDYPEALDPVIRRGAYAAFLGKAAGVFAPSEDIRRRLVAAGAPYPIEVHPHEPPVTPQVADWRAGEVINIATLGAIGLHKGALVILNLARDAKARSLPLRFHIVGYSDRTEEMKGAGVVETGRYTAEEDAVALLRRIDPACLFLPSIWPETFCYTLSVAFALGLPPVVFDLGAQKDRVEEAGFGAVLPYALVDDVQALNDRLCRLEEVLRSSAPRPAPAAERAAPRREQLVLTDYIA